MAQTLQAAQARRELSIDVLWSTSDAQILSYGGRRERILRVTFAITFGIVRQFSWFFWPLQEHGRGAQCFSTKKFGKAAEAKRELFSEQNLKLQTGHWIYFGG